MNKENVNRLLIAGLGVAVVILFILHFTTGPKKAEEGATTQLPREAAENELRVAYVFVDSVLANYEYYKVLTDRLLAKKTNLEKELLGKGEAFQKQVNDFQYKVEKRLITSWDAETRQKELGEQQQVLINLQNEMQSRLMQDEQAVTIQLHDSVMAAVSDVNRGMGYTIILSNTFGGGLLYAEDRMNITPQVLDRLNETYRKTLGTK
ncbi:MAG: OmpH family outer membrane protein [Bacteroidales bacterium]